MSPDSCDESLLDGELIRRRIRHPLDYLDGRSRNNRHQHGVCHRSICGCESTMVWVRVVPLSSERPPVKPNCVETSGGRNNVGGLVI
jgi:hypothetical protein